MRSELELRDGRLYAKGEAEPFQGKLVENHGPGRRKLEIDISGGKANGLSRGWYDNRQMEVEETFRDGISHGPRTRWHANGKRRSLAQIENGEVVGEFLEWYDNGQLAVRLTLADGQPAGTVEAWYPSGAKKSRTQFEHGRQVSREFFNDSAAIFGCNQSVIIWSATLRQHPKPQTHE
jgi:antitoxin component YwqK of YwqJK toxin-antitoxin module